MANNRYAITRNDLKIKLPSAIKIDTGINLGRLIKFDIEPSGFSQAELVQKFQNAVNRATAKFAAELGDQLDAAIKADVWQGGDLYDTGELLSSGRVVLTDNGFSVVYDAPYAMLLHYGGYIHPYGNENARVYLPPRPWVEAVLTGNGPIDQIQWERYYIEAISAEFA